MKVTLKQLSYFVALAEQGNFGRAAEVCNISQPALSMQIKELESNLDVILVERRPREVCLTRVGRSVLERARGILAQTRDLEALPRRARGLMGELHIGVIPTVAPYLLPPTLTRLRALDLTLDIRVREAPTHVLLGQLENGVLDAVVVALPVDLPWTQARPLFEDRFLLAGSTARLERLIGQGGRLSEALRPQTLDPDQLLLLDEGHCLSDQAIAACGIDPARRRIDLGASSLATLCGLVSEGFGLTFLPELALATEMAAAPRLRLHRFAEPQPARTLALVRRAGAAQQEDWFAELATLMQEAGADVIARGAAGARPA
ncbi:MAG: LysR family hydrogen peroxide-inducible transcriptional activator [Paracoccaceae bacterium]|jgi:LysR family hydrogen peroxide-inducible transcriptional activator